MYIPCKPPELKWKATKLNEDAAAIVNRAVANGLMLNISIKKSIILGSAQNNFWFNRTTSAPYTVMPPQSLSQDSSWNQQLAQVYSRMCGSLYRLRFRVNSLSSTMKTRLVNALIVPNFDSPCLSSKNMPLCVYNSSVSSIPLCALFFCFINLFQWSLISVTVNLMLRKPIKSFTLVLFQHLHKSYEIKKKSMEINI